MPLHFDLDAYHGRIYHGAIPLFLLRTFIYQFDSNIEALTLCIYAISDSVVGIVYKGALTYILASFSTLLGLLCLFPMSNLFFLPTWHCSTRDNGFPCIKTAKGLG